MEEIREAWRNEGFVEVAEGVREKTDGEEPDRLIMEAWRLVVKDLYELRELALARAKNTVEWSRKPQ